jgi:2-dehydro-3-deoxygluconokinase
MLRITAPRGERLDTARRLDTYVAGAEANVSVALARLGVPTAWLSALPTSPLGDRVSAELVAAGVDVSFVKRLPDVRLGLFFVEQGFDPRPSRVWYDRADSAFTRLDRLEPAPLDGAEVAFVSGITPALGAGSKELVDDFIEQARGRQVRLCIDVNYRALLWTAAEARNILAPLIARADIVVCGERDAQAVFEVDCDDVEAAKRLASVWAPDASVVVLTRSDRGSAAVAGGEVIRQAAYPTRVVDRFGAGDAFTAGLLWGLLEGLDLKGALSAASALASLKCTILGDFAQFSREELAAAMRESDGGAIIR